MENLNFDFLKNRTLDELLHTVLNRALVSIKSQKGSIISGSIMLLDKPNGFLNIKARLGPPRPQRTRETRYRINDKGIAAWVVKEKKPYLCSNVEEDSNFSPSNSRGNFKSLLSVPIIYREDVVAVINADASKANHFDKNDVRQIEILAKAAAQPIAERISITDALIEIGVELTKMPQIGGIDYVLDKIANVAIKTLGVDVVTLYQYNQEKDEFPVEGKGPTIAGEIYKPQFMQRKVYPEDVPFILVKKREWGYYPNVHKVGILKENEERERPRFIERENIKSMAALLLPYRAIDDPSEEIVGVMFANYRTQHEFNNEEQEVLKTFSNFAAIAIQNVRREEKRIGEQLNLVNSFSSSLAHRMSNLGGTGRIYAQLLKDLIRNKGISKREGRSLDWLDQIEQEANILLKLTDRIKRRLREGGTDTTKLTDLDLSLLINKVKNRAVEVNAVPENTQIIIGNIPDFPKVRSIDFQLEEVFYDLFKNAFEAIETFSEDRPFNYTGILNVEAEYFETDNYMRVRIKDNGTGISEEMEKNLFSPGHSTKKGNLGIGLWWSRIFLLATGGELTLVETKLGNGSTFEVKIPCLATISN